MRAAHESRHHHQSAATRRANGLRPLARSAFDRAIAEGRRQTSSGALEIDAEHGTLVEVLLGNGNIASSFAFLNSTEEFMEAKMGRGIGSWAYRYRSSFCYGCSSATNACQCHVVLNQAPLVAEPFFAGAHIAYGALFRSFSDMTRCTRIKRSEKRGRYRSRADQDLGPGKFGQCSKSIVVPARTRSGL